MSKVTRRSLEPAQPWLAVPRAKPSHGREAQVSAVMMFCLGWGREEV